MDRVAHEPVARDFKDKKIGFSFDEPWDGFYAIGHLDGLEVHLKEAPKKERDW